MILGLSRSLCDCANKFKDCHAENNQRNHRYRGRLHWQLALTGRSYIAVLDATKRETQENGYFTLIFFRIPRKNPLRLMV